MQEVKETLTQATSSLPRSQQSIFLRSALSNLLLSAAGIGLIIWSFRLIETRLTSVISHDAVINGVLIDLKTPSEGIISQLSTITGEIAAQSQMLIILKNERVSELRMQEITSRLNGQKSQLEEAKAQLARQLSLLKILKLEQHHYRRLRIQEAQQSSAQVRADLDAARARLQLAKVNYKRTIYLSAAGALAEADLDTARLEMQESEAKVSQLEARLQEFHADEKAAQLDMSLDWSSSNFDPRIRLQQLHLDIADRQQAIETLQDAIPDTYSELKQAQVDFARQQTIAIRSPVPGIIWRLDAHTGQFIRGGESLGKILDCKRRWVDVYLEEQALRALQPNTPATVELYGSRAEVLSGRISLMRSGVGRLAAGEDVAVPLIPNLPRHSQVRVELEPETKKGAPNLFCYVGYTARVTFKVKNTP